ncbi:MAG TPA: ABC transporter permease [Gemmatimonadales bacterium]|jgi:ABC-2 type transport system permease protein|nr:ABC transporter permease [Gemmatimonadales bacterium]
MTPLLTRLTRLPRLIPSWNIWPMLLKELTQLRRDRLTFAMMTGIPAIQLLLFGFAIQTEVRHLPTVVLDESATEESRALVTRVLNTGNFDLLAHVADRGAVREALESGAARAAVVIPPEYARDLKRGRTAQAQVIVDAADPMASAAALSGAAQAAQVEAQARLGLRRALPLEVRVRPWYNPDGRSSTYIVPGIIGVLLSMTLVLITAMAIVREREKGTLEQLVVTPISRTSIMLGKLAPFLLIGYIQVTVVLVLGRLVFDVPIRGSLWSLYLLSLPFMAASLGVGLFLSTLVRTQAQAVQLGFFYMMPNILLSGFMFPRIAMPWAAQALGAILPLTYYLDLLRNILVKGVAPHHLVKDGLILTGFAALFIALAVRRFHKTVD